MSPCLSPNRIGLPSKSLPSIPKALIFFVTYHVCNTYGFNYLNVNYANVSPAVKESCLLMVSLLGGRVLPHARYVCETLRDSLGVSQRVVGKSHDFSLWSK